MILGIILVGGLILIIINMSIDNFKDSWNNHCK